MTHRLTAFAFVGLVCLALAVPALAHASLVSSDPPAGGTLTSAPHTLTATFDEELTPDGSSIVVESPAGLQVATATVSASDHKTMIAELPPLPAGRYTVRWTAVTADDLAIERGTYAFSVGSASATETPMTTSPPPVVASASGNDLVIALVLAGIAVIGVLAFVFVRGRR